MPDYSELNIKNLLTAYMTGIFPMAHSRHSQTFDWIEPIKRGIIPLDNFHISKSLHKLLKKNPFEVRFDTAFTSVMEHCAMREDTWINDDIITLYTQLFNMGLAKSVECWQDNKLVGGLYGVCINKAFFGESMFSIKENASKVALVFLVRWLKEHNFNLLDTQFLTPHLASMGGIEIPEEEYLKLLNKALI